MKIIAIIGISILVGFISGNASVYGFNHLPDRWFGVDESDRYWQRVKSIPWKYILPATFIVCGIYMGLKDPIRATGVFAAVFVLVWMAMASKIYGRVPRALVWLLLICGIGILPFDHSIKTGILGLIVMAVAGGIICLIEYLFQRRSSRGSEGKPTVHTDMIEMMAVIGLLIGFVQGLLVIQASLLVWAIRSALGNEGKVGFKKKEEFTFYIAIVTAIWMVINIGHSIL